VFTVFHLLQFLVVGTGLVVGAIVGNVWFGSAGLLGGAVAGVLAGVFVGRLPLAIAAYWATREFRQKTIAELHEYLRGPVWPAYHMAFAELSRRGEDVSGDFDVVRGLLGDDEIVKRTHGIAILRVHYPRVVEQIPDYDPNEVPEVCREKLAKLV
jgi:hypothetical protein